MFSPIILAGRFTTTLDGIDNEQINQDVLKRKDMKLDDTPGNTFQEDSFYPETEACMHLLKEVDKVDSGLHTSIWNEYMTIAGELGGKQ